MTDALTPDDLALLEAYDRHTRENRIEHWHPYPKQAEFLALGARCTERCLFAGNQLGKSDTGAYETAYHLTGLYPSDWTGHRFTRPTKMWAAGPSTTVVRDTAQTKLCGPAGVKDEWGTGFVPRGHLLGSTVARGAVADALDSIKVQHHDRHGVPDGTSQLWFKSYEQGREKFQSATLDGIWWDEEPPEDIYTEGLARLTATRGISYLTFTPLWGMSTVVIKFVEDHDAESRRGFVRMGFADALHLNDDDRKRKLSEYPPHEHQARLEGLPMLGHGRVFTQDQRELQFDPGLQIPPYWTKVWGLDFGISHNFAAVLCLYDREADTFYVYKTYRVADAIPITHVDAILRIAADVPVAWPHDGSARDKGSGETLAKQYKMLGLRMLDSHATFPGGGFSTEAAILEMQQRMRDGRFRVAADLVDWWEEYRMYHRDEKGQLVKLRDDLLSATMKAFMMRRFAKAVRIASAGRRPEVVEQKAGAQAWDVFTGQPLAGGAETPWGF